MWHLLMWFDAVSLAPLRLVGLAVLLAVSWVVISPSRRDFATLRDVARSLVPRPRAAPPKLAEG
jgi:hypothetical protein